MTGRFGAPANQALSDWMDEAGVPNPLRGVDWLSYNRSTLPADVRATWERAIETFFRRITRAQIREEGRRRGINACAVATPADVLSDPHLEAREFWQPTPDGRVPRRFAALRAGPADAAPRSESRARLDRPGPLAGLRVLDFSWALVGSITTKVLGDLGADVVKIESRTRPCLSRLDVQVSVSKAGDFDDKPWFAHLNTSKRSLALDMKRPESREILEPLLDWADVVVENFSPGTMAKLGLDYDTLVRRQSRPRDGVRQRLRPDGPARAGMGRRRHRRRAVGPNVPHRLVRSRSGDSGQRALRRRDRALRDGRARRLRRPASARDRSRRARRRIDVRDLRPADLARGASRPRWRGAGSPRQRRSRRLPPGRLSRRGTRPLDRDHASTTRRSGRDSSVSRERESFVAWTATQEDHALVERLQQAGFAAGVVQDIEDLFADVGLRARGALVPLVHARLGEFGHVRTPLSLSRDVVRPYRPPSLGEHGEAIARDLAGLPEERVAQLRELGVFR